MDEIALSGTPSEVLAEYMNKEVLSFSSNFSDLVLCWSNQTLIVVEKDLLISYDQNEH